MKPILTIAFSLLLNALVAQTTQPENLSQYEKFVARAGSLILSSNEEVFEAGGLESLEISLAKAIDITRNREEVKALVVSVNKSNAYLSKRETQQLVNQMKKIQLLLVDGEISKEHAVSFNIRNGLLIEVSYNTSKKAWKYGMGVNSDGRKKIKEVTSTEFQDIKIKLEEQLPKL